MSRIVTIKHECGCVSEKDRERWVILCPKHDDEERLYRIEAARGHAELHLAQLRRELA
jgi:hypothetical protein